MNRQNRTRILGAALLMTAALTLPGAARAAGDPSVVHVDGYLTSQGNRCLVLREHDGKTYGLVGAVGGLQTGDHVRLEGRFVDGSGCGSGTAVNVIDVQAIWGDDNHRTTYYDHLQNGSFSQWAAANRGYNSQYGRDSRGGRGMPLMARLSFLGSRPSRWSARSRCRSRAKPPTEPWPGR